MNFFIRRASSFMGISSGDVPEQLSKLEEKETLFCKNNVCIHPSSLSRGEEEHYPGYLSIKAHHNEGSKSSLILSWIPNSSIKRNPRSLENRTPAHSPCHSSRSSACPSPRKSPRHSLTSNNSGSNVTPSFGLGNEKLIQDDLGRLIDDPVEPESFHDDAIEGGEVTFTAEDLKSDCNFDLGLGVQLENGDEESNVISNESKPVFTCDVELVDDNCQESRAINDDIDSVDSEVLVNDIKSQDSKFEDGDKLFSKKDLSLNLDICDNHENFANLKSQNDSPNHSNSESLSLSVNSHDIDFDEVAQSCSFNTITREEKTDLEDSDSLNGSVSPSKKAKSYRPIYIDLCQMKSLRLLFDYRNSDCGQLMIASRDRYYTILHFHHGGLDKLAKIFEDVDFLTKSKSLFLPYRLFSVSRPTISNEECHPEEGLYCTVDETMWESLLNEHGQIVDEFQLKKIIFFGGLNSNMRSEIWPFLLHCYPFKSSFESRERIRTEHELEYLKVDKKRENLSNMDKNSFYRNIQSTVEKDVVRTDRSHRFFAGDNNPNLEIMKKILLNYAIYNPTIGYTQGMSDILAPILIEVQQEAETFWCFVGLMQRTIFISSPTDNDMDFHLNYIRELIRLMVPTFYKHLLTHPDYMELLFCHRWILLCFKREFSEAEALKMWEACWAQYETKYFHLFLCVAIVAIYCDDVIQQDMNSDEMLLYFSSLSMHMNGDFVLRKARGLLYQFLHSSPSSSLLSELCESLEAKKCDQENSNDYK